MTIFFCKVHMFSYKINFKIKIYSFFFLKNKIYIYIYINSELIATNTFRFSNKRSFFSIFDQLRSSKPEDRLQQKWESVELEKDRFIDYKSIFPTHEVDSAICFWEGRRRRKKFEHFLRLRSWLITPRKNFFNSWSDLGLFSPSRFLISSKDWLFLFFSVFLWFSFLVYLVLILKLEDV